MSKESKGKNWPMPQETKHQDWGRTVPGEKAKGTNIDDTMTSIESAQSHNAKVLGRQSPKKFA